MKLLIIATLILCLSSIYVLAWEGYDYDKGAYIEIEKGNLVREREDIEIYDYNDSDYHDVEVELIDRYGGSVELEVYDYETGEYRTLEMED